jgi:hypothetical protein
MKGSAQKDEEITLRIDELGLRITGDNEQRCITDIHGNRIVFAFDEPGEEAGMKITLIRSHDAGSEDIQETLIPLSRFLEFFLQRPVIPRIPETSASSFRLGDDPHRERGDSGYERNIRPLISIEDLSLDLEGMIRTWQKEFRLLSPMIEQYLSSTFAGPLGLQYRFLGYIQAIEIFHRRKYPGKYMSDDAFEPVKAEIMKVIERAPRNRPFKKTINRRLNYIHEYDLKDRLEEIGSDKRELVRPFIYRYADFVKDVTSLRNYFTHFDEKRRIGDMSREHIEELIKALKVLNEICILSLLPLSNEIIEKGLGSRSEYSSLLNTDQGA